MTMQPHMLEGMRLRCPRCGEAEIIGHESLGKRGRCRRCGTLFQIPRPAFAGAAPARPHAAAAGPSYTLVIVAVAMVTAILVGGGIFAFERMKESRLEKESMDATSAHGYGSATRAPVEAHQSVRPELENDITPPTREPLDGSTEMKNPHEVPDGSAERAIEPAPKQP
jgi:hypothetical protein